LETSSPNGWSELAAFQADRAMEIFEAQLREQPDSREARLGKALSLLGMQPSTEKNIHEAEAIFADLEADTEAPYAAEAGYYLARIPDLFRRNRDPEAAASRYARCVERFAGHPFADAAAVKLYQLRLFELSGGDVNEIVTTLDATESVRDRMVSETALRDFSLLLADAASFYNLEPQRILGYLRNAMETGQVVGLAKGDLLIRLGVQAAAIGANEEAIGYFEEFLREFPQNNRVQLVLDKVEELRSR
jgi:tetratricopeptide (TPR) repeat protein